MINYLVLYGTPGQTTVTDPRLAYVNMLVVKRSGIEYDFVPELPGSRQVFYERNLGRLWFDPFSPFTGPPETDLPVSILDFESVYLMYET